MLPLYVELARPSIRRMRKVFKRGLGIISVLYSWEICVVSVCAAMAFTCNPFSENFTFCGNSLVTFHVHCVWTAFISLFGFLLFLDNVCSNLLLNNFRKHFDVVIAALGISISCILTEPIFSYNFRRMIGILVWGKTTNEITTFWHVLITFLFVSANVALGVAVKSIAVVFGFLGSTSLVIYHSEVMNARESACTYPICLFIQRIRSWDTFSQQHSSTR